MMMNPEYAARKAPCAAKASATSSIPQLCVPGDVSFTFHHAAAAVAEVDFSTDACQSPHVTLNAREYADHVAAVVARARSLAASAHRELSSDGNADAGASRARSALKEPADVLMTVIEDLVNELEAATRRSNHHEHRAQYFEVACVAEASKCDELVKTLETRDRIIACLRANLDSAECPNGGQEPTTSPEAASQIETCGPPEMPLAASGSECEINSDAASTLSLMASDDESDEAIAPSGTIADADAGVEAQAEQHVEQLTAQELREREVETNMVLRVLDVRDLIATETLKKKTPFKHRARFEKHLRGLAHVVNSDPAQFAGCSTSIKGVFKLCGMSLVNTPGFGNCQFDALTETALECSLLQLHQLANAPHAAPAIVEQYLASVHAVKLLKCAISASAMHRSEEQYPDCVLGALVAETGREFMEEECSDATMVNRAIFNDYWHSIASNSSDVYAMVPAEEWGNSLTLIQACKVLARPIHLLTQQNAKGSYEAHVTFQRYVPEDPSGPASLFLSYDDSNLASFGAWTQVLVDDIEAAKADPCLMPLVLVLHGQHYQAALMDSSAMASAGQLLTKMSAKVRKPVKTVIVPVVEEPSTTAALPLTRSVDSSATEKPSFSSSAGLGSCETTAVCITATDDRLYTPVTEPVASARTEGQQSSSLISSVSTVPLDVDSSSTKTSPSPVATAAVDATVVDADPTRIDEHERTTSEFEPVTKTREDGLQSSDASVNASTCIITPEPDRARRIQRPALKPVARPALKSAATKPAERAGPKPVQQQAESKPTPVRALQQRPAPKQTAPKPVERPAAKPVHQQLQSKLTPAKPARRPAPTPASPVASGPTATGTTVARSAARAPAPSAAPRTRSVAPARASVAPLPRPSKGAVAPARETRETVAAARKSVAAREGVAATGLPGAKAAKKAVSRPRWQ